MLHKIDRQACFDRYPIMPYQVYDESNDELIFFYPTVFQRHILTLSSRTFRGHAKALGNEMTQLTRSFNIEALIFIGDTSTPWLYQQNDHKPVMEAEAYLRKNKVGKRFNGALEVPSSELPVFIMHLAWLTRCNAALPIFHFIDKEQNIIGNICRYGNLHIDTMHQKADKVLASFVDSSKFEYGSNESCHNRFGRTSAISGRRTML